MDKIVDTKPSTTQPCHKACKLCTKTCVFPSQWSILKPGYVLEVVESQEGPKLNNIYYLWLLGAEGNVMQERDFACLYIFAIFVLNVKILTSVP